MARQAMTAHNNQVKRRVRDVPWQSILLTINLKLLRVQPSNGAGTPAQTSAVPRQQSALNSSCPHLVEARFQIGLTRNVARRFGVS
jgi:hypothetical protein